LTLFAALSVKISGTCISVTDFVSVIAFMLDSFIKLAVKITHSDC